MEWTWAACGRVRDERSPTGKRGEGFGAGRPEIPTRFLTECVTRGQSLPSLIVSFLTCQMPFLAYIVPILQDFLGGSDSKESAYHVGEPGSIPGPGRSSGEGKWQLTPVLLPGKSHGWRSLVGYMGSQRVGLD